MAEFPLTLAIVRRCLLGILSIGLVGTEIELLLLKHTDGVWQLTPVLLVAVAIIGVTWFVAGGGAAALRSIQVTMLIFIASGVTGMVLHFRGNVSYEQDSNPSLSGLALYRGALQGSTPSLAPGTMVQLGLLGLLFTFRHPGLGRAPRREDPPPLDRTVT